MTTHAAPFDARMPRPVHVQLCNQLMTEMASPSDCAHTLARTRRVLASIQHDATAALAWLADHGAHCDCEVLLNTLPPD